LEQAIASSPTTNAQAMLKHLQDKVHSFIGEAEPPDDLTIVVLQVRTQDVKIL
jgi:serine phosphatase RsbU (regulator of sigma subunit)